MFSCYILYSKALGRFYIGSSQTTPEERLAKHNTAFYLGQHYTSATSDWTLFLVISCTSFSQARKIENHIKRMKSRKYVSNLKIYPEMIEKLLSTYT